MIGSTRQLSVYAYGAPVDMRKGFDGLSSLVERELGRDPLSGDLFLFVSRTRRLAKVLLWDGGQAEAEPEPWRSHPSVEVGLDRHIRAFFQGLDLEPDLPPSGVDDPQLGHAGIGVAKRKLLGVLALRAVADHLDDQVRGAFHLHISARLLGSGRHVADPSLLERSPEDDDHIRLG